MAAVPSPSKPYETSSDTPRPISTPKIQDISSTTTVVNSPTVSDNYSTPYGQGYTPYGQYGQGSTPYGQYGQGYTPYGPVPMMPGFVSPLMSHADYMMANMDMGVRSVARVSQLLQGNFEALHMGGLSLIRLFGNLSLLKYELTGILRSFAILQSANMFWLKIKRSILNLFRSRPKKSLNDVFDEAWTDATHQLDVVSVFFLSIFLYYFIKYLRKTFFPPPPPSQEVVIKPTQLPGQQQQQQQQQQLVPSSSYPGIQGQSLMIPHPSQMLSPLPYSQMRFGAGGMNMGMGGMNMGMGMGGMNMGSMNMGSMNMGMSGIGNSYPPSQLGPGSGYPQNNYPTSTSLATTSIGINSNATGTTVAGSSSTTTTTVTETVKSSDSAN